MVHSSQGTLICYLHSKLIKGVSSLMHLKDKGSGSRACVDDTAATSPTVRLRLLGHYELRRALLTHLSI